MPDFQQSVNVQPAPAVEGDFASANPRRSMLAGPGALVSGDAAGVLVGRFAFARDADGLVRNATWAAAERVGFVQRNQFVAITPWLGEASMAVPQGVEVTLFDGGDFWCRFAAGAAIGQEVFVLDADGSAVAGAPGAPPALHSKTGFFVQSTAAAGELAKISDKQPLG